ncbi:hypothetical protein HYC85_014573 [Camellia sinensis]|uniref:DNA polymerase delta subunit 3 n=1 Tax=Camellia sinensis TaxID=4442 RepID=A0A7J7HA18_CAMSI|nr:hypothetical protein HYC85_014573 [Camellia sinensis]
MAEVETLGILEEIQALVSDKLQVVSYKWLSRNFLLPSNVSKRLLQEFVEKHGSGFEVVYTLSGWLKNNPSVYHIRLVSGPKLSESKQEFDGNCSVQVYSVQACIPKDPAALWNAEFVQAEELFRQPPTIDNCLRDNRYSSSILKYLNSVMSASADGTAVSIAAPQPKNAVVAGPSRSNSMIQKATISQPQQKKVQQSSPKIKKKLLNCLLTKRKVKTDKSTSGNGGSLANMWGRAAAKPKPISATTETNVPIPIVSAEAQICAREAIEATSSDDDGQDVNFKRASKGEGSRKRRVVFDFSDEDDEYKDAVNLASPDPPKIQTFLDKQTTKSPIPEKINMDIDMQKVVKPKVKEETVAKETNQLSREDSSDVSKRKTEISSSDKVHSLPENNVNAKDKVVDAASTSPKRRKVLKTRIDERGREVTEVVWEGGETETKADINTMKKADNNAVSNTINRAAAPAAKKSPAVGGTAPSNPGGKAGNKKAANVKDPKQGNIMSFFKRV